jgi:hypothetical protein
LPAENDWRTIKAKTERKLLLVLEFNIICVNAFASTQDSGINADDDTDSIANPVDGGVIQDANGDPSSPPPHAPVEEEEDDDDDGPDGGGHCCRPLNDPLVDAILLVLNKFILLLLQKIGCVFERIQLIGSQAKTLSDCFEKDAVTTIFHPAVVQRGLKDEEIDNLNPYQMQAVNAFVLELIRTHPFYDNVNEEKIFKAFKGVMVKEQQMYKYLFASNYETMKTNSMSIKEALYRFRNQNWASNMKRTTYDLDEAQRITSSKEYEEGFSTFICLYVDQNVKDRMYLITNVNKKGEG